MKLSQSNVIFFCLFAAFIVFITLRGEMPKYLDVLFTSKAGGDTGGTSASSGGGSGSVLGNGVLGQASSAIDGIRSGILGAAGIPSSISGIGSSVSGFLGGLFN